MGQDPEEIHLYWDIFVKQAVYSRQASCAGSLEVEFEWEKPT